ncbi:MAG: macro domain-containing protein [Bifidobacteriaceae bacterium]|nr:macro domain-containing protein [Bifidobacteriaceae bacterium]
MNAANSSLYGGGGVDGAIHRAAGPVYSRNQDHSGTLASCYRESLRVADELGAESVAFPTISAGVYGWPIADATRIAVTTIRATPSVSGPGRRMTARPTTGHRGGPAPASDRAFRDRGSSRRRPFDSPSLPSG